jgi:hypothetical protein
MGLPSPVLAVVRAVVPAAMPRSDEVSRSVDRPAVEDLVDEAVLEGAEASQVTGWRSAVKEARPANWTDPPGAAGAERRS